MTKAFNVRDVACMYWGEEDARAVVAAWQASGESLSAFARHHGVQRRRIARWIRRLETATPVHFLPVRITEAVDPTASPGLRRGFDGLAAATRDVIRLEPMSGHVFGFLNRRKNRIKLLVWDRTGYLVVYKRLEVGTFAVSTTPAPGHRHVEMDAGDLALMLEGVDLRGAVRRTRWRRLPPR